MEYKITVYKDGKIMIPTPIRKLMNINLSDNLLISMVDDKMQITTLEQKLANAQNTISKLNSDFSNRWI